MTTKKISFGFILLALTLFLSNTLSAAGNTVVDIGYEQGNTAWVKAVNDGGLLPTLTEHGPFTVFVPTNEAFSVAKPTADLARQIVLHHTLQGAYTLDELSKADGFKTAVGGDIDIAVVDGALVIDGKLRIVTADLPASNGIVHIVDAVNPLPDAYTENIVAPKDPHAGTVLGTLTKDADCTRFVSAIEELGLEHLLNAEHGFTVFVPTDDVFEGIDKKTLAKWHSNHALFRQIMLYHIVPGTLAVEDGVATNTALGKPIIMWDKQINGFTHIVDTMTVGKSTIHIIDDVLMPSENYGYNAPPTHKVEGNSLIAVAQREPRLTKFVDNVELAGLENLLAKHGDFTVIAPINTAYANVDPAIDRLDHVDHRMLKEEVLYQIVPGEWTVDEIEKADSLPTALGMPVLTNGFTIVGQLEADNGIIYLVDTVMIPEHHLR